MIYLSGRNDLFAKQKWFISNHKTLGTIQLFWQAVPKINHLKMVATSGRERFTYGNEIYVDDAFSEEELGLICGTYALGNFKRNEFYIFSSSICY